VKFDDDDDDDLVDDLSCNIMLVADPIKCMIRKRKIHDGELVDDLGKVGNFVKKAIIGPPAWGKKKMDDDDLVDDLGSAKGKIGKFSGGIKWADNSLTCDSEGNCMLKDELLAYKD